MFSFENFPFISPESGSECAFRGSRIRTKNECRSMRVRVHSSGHRYLSILICAVPLMHPKLHTLPRASQLFHSDSQWDVHGPPNYPVPFLQGGHKIRICRYLLTGFRIRIEFTVDKGSGSHYWKILLPKSREMFGASLKFRSLYLSRFTSTHLYTL